MIIEALAPLHIKTKTRGVLKLTPGQSMELPDRAVGQLLQQVPEKIRVIRATHSPGPGVWIEFDSPLFGTCTAKVKVMTIRGLVVTDHSVLGPTQEVAIQAAWIRHIGHEESS